LKLKRDEPKKTLTKEHQYPRKKAAEDLLNNRLSEIERNNDLLIKLYEGKYAMFNYVTSSENRIVSKYQRTENFVDVEQAYIEADIKLIEISNEELKKVKKGNEEVIDEILKKHKISN